MSEPIITVENLGKRYSLRHKREERYTALRDVISEKATGLFKKLKSKNGSGAPTSEIRSCTSGFSVSDAPRAREDFWALRDVSFSVAQGEVVGIIGRNGAGKSTLLKILSRITDPTEGRVMLRGRVASLLEVGTGFHPELTGRENIYLNGAILGMIRAEIRKKFDEIVAFAEVEKFLDTPVKRYSSGMYVRLAFAVAAHLEPEILIVDEVLAVGDAEFQKKCLGKMENVAKREGRTVLFVSHNMAAIESLCQKAIYLKSGIVQAINRTDEVVRTYLHSISSGTKGDENICALGPDLVVRTLQFKPNPIVCGQSAAVRLELDSKESIRLSDLALILYSNYGVRIGIIDLRQFGVCDRGFEKGLIVIEGIINDLRLIEGDYRVGIYVRGKKYQADIPDVAVFSMMNESVPKIAPYSPAHRGFIQFDFNLTTLSRISN